MHPDPVEWCKQFSGSSSFTLERNLLLHFRWIEVRWIPSFTSHSLNICPIALHLSGEDEMQVSHKETLQHHLIPLEASLAHTQAYAGTFHPDKHTGLTQSHPRVGNIINGVSEWLTSSLTSCFPFYILAVHTLIFQLPPLCRWHMDRSTLNSHPAQDGSFTLRNQR